MPSIRAAQGRSEGFVLLSNMCARDRRLSGLARGIVYIVLSYPADWVFTIDWLMEQMTDGRQAIRKALNELERYGYLSRRRISRGRGRFEWDQTLSDEPLDGTKPQVVSSGDMRTDETTSENTTSPQVTSSGGNRTDETTSNDAPSPQVTAPASGLTSGDFSSGENRTHETTCGNTTKPQVVSSGGFSSDENRHFIHRDGGPNTVTEDELATTGPPDFAAPLIRALQARGLIGLTWNLNGQWALIAALIEAKGIDAMAAHAAAASTGRQIRTAKYFINGWKSLPPKAPDGTTLPALRPVGGTAPTRRQQELTEKQARQERALARARAKSQGAGA